MTRHDLLGAALIAVLTVVLCSLAGAAYYLAQSEPRDAQSLCSMDGSVPHTLMLVDRTDPLTTEQVALLARAVDDTLATLKIGERFSIFLIEGTPSSAPASVFSICRPPDGSDANWIYQNVRLLQAKYADRFASSLDAALRGFRKPARAGNSPIMEVIRDVVAQPAFARTKGARKLIVVSDFLQNVPAYSQYRSVPNYESFRETSYARQVRTDLKGVSVTLVYLPNRPFAHLQTEQHHEFWRRYFVESGASAVQEVP